MANPESEPHGGLSLDDIPPLEEDERPPNPYEDLFDQAVNELENRKIKLNLDAPEEELVELPADLTTLGQALFDYHQVTLKHWNWIASVYAELEGRLVALQEQLDRIVAALRVKYKKREKDDPIIVMDEEYTRCNVRITKIRVQLKMVDVEKGKLYKRMQLLSRSVEGAKMEHEGTGRSETFGKRPFRGRRGDLPTDQ